MNSAHLTLAHSSAPNELVRRFNIALSIAALMLLMYYVVQVNQLAAQNWGIQSANEQLGTLRDARNALVAQEAALDDRQSLTSLAQSIGLVPAGPVVYLVQDHAVAAK